VITNQIYHFNYFWHVGPVVGQKMKNSGDYSFTAVCSCPNLLFFSRYPFTGHALISPSLVELITLSLSLSLSPNTPSRTSAKKMASSGCSDYLYQNQQHVIARWGNFSQMNTFLGALPVSIPLVVLSPFNFGQFLSKPDGSAFFRWFY